MASSSSSSTTMASSSSSSSTTKTVTVKCADGVLLEVEETVANMSSTMKKLMQDSAMITLPDIGSEIMRKILEFMKKHADDSSASESDKASLKAWDQEFIQVDKETILHLISGARHLELEKLVNLGCRAIAEKIRRETLSFIKND